MFDPERRRVPYVVIPSREADAGAARSQNPAVRVAMLLVLIAALPAAASPSTPIQMLAPKTSFASDGGVEQLLWTLARSSAEVLIGMSLLIVVGLCCWWVFPGRRASGGLQILRGGIVAALAVSLASMWIPPALHPWLIPPACALGLWGFGFGWSIVRGTWTALAWVAATALALGIAVATLFQASTDVAAAVDIMPTPTAADRKRWNEMLHDAGDSQEQQAVELTLPSQDLNLLATSWLAARDIPVRVEFALMRETLTADWTLPLSGPVIDGRFVNGLAELRPDVSSGKLQLQLQSLRIGSISAPARLVSWVSQWLSSAINTDRQAGRVLASVHNLELVDEGLTLLIEPNQAAEGILDASRGPDDPQQNALKERVRAYMMHLVENAQDLPEGDERFFGLIDEAFRLARSRSNSETAADENEAALIALGIQAGDPRVRRLAGFAADEPLPHFRYPFDRKITLRGRNDLARHFFVSAALSVLANEGISQAVGLIKEQLDAADGGSGFSFADLAADLAGAQFARVATSDGQAAALQDRLGEPFAVDDLMPSIEGLPESLSDQQFAEQYGSLTDPRFLKMTVEIQQRLLTCELLNLGDSRP